MRLGDPVAFGVFLGWLSYSKPHFRREPSLLDPRLALVLGRMASGDFSQRRTVYRPIPGSSVITRIEPPAQFILYMSFTSPTFNKTLQAPLRVKDGEKMYYLGVEGRHS